MINIDDNKQFWKIIKLLSEKSKKSLKITLKNQDRIFLMMKNLNSLKIQ